MENMVSETTYRAPQAKVLEVKGQSVLCSSNPNPGYPTEFEEENE